MDYLLTGKCWWIDVPDEFGKLRIEYDDDIPYDGSWAEFEVDALDLYQKLKEYFGE